MQLVVNAVAADVADTATIADVVVGLAGVADPRGIAVALNGAVVPRARWADTRPADGDTVEVLTAVQGG
ncbi:sulfur carrier protein ThiS [Dactylosporangium aurantiacum]|uniref:Sulfur carrier protein ThiS n=1 Tax=Dactylosporangium aurantiacum TaxID=35754 RepID=A0A9Q9IWA3_9ACTN|nr:sulfur carrier protein ThiS [Dactylosporangium aurantiacum]MDG6102504.1 sulfur carrier protein ThiS [Dactylosporangium aurantiacum]UWZ60073.1 sulfur carrier protein ThiS [Dactylosporangium aurantiacum]